MVKYKFNDIAINSTLKKKPVEDDKYHYIGLEHLDSGSLQVTRYGSEVAPKGEKLIMKKGDVLFGKRRAYQKKVGIAPFDGIFSAHGMVLRPKEDVVDKDFFPLFINSDYFLDAAIKISVGSLSPTINWGDLKELEFELPGLEEQRKLAKILWAAKETKQAYKNLLQKTDLLIDSEFQKMFIGKYPEKPIRNFVSQKFEKAKSRWNIDDVIKYIEISSLDIENNKINYSEQRLSDAPVSATIVLKKDDILISKVRPNLKKNVINRLDDNNLVGTNGFVVLRSTNYPVEFLWGCIHNENFVNKMVAAATGSTYPTIKDSDVLDYLIPTPSMEKADMYADIYRAIERSKRQLQKSLDNLNSSMHALINENLK